MLVTPKAKSNGTAFAVGYVLGFALVGTIVIVLAGGKDYSSGRRPDADRQHHQAGSRTVAAARRRAPMARTPTGGRDAEDAEVDGHDRLVHSRESFGLGVLLSAVNPKNLAMSLATGLPIAQAAIPTGQEAVVLIIYVVIGASTVLAPVVVYFTIGDRAATILGGWRKWLEENNAVVGAVVLLVLAAVLIGHGITGLS